MDSRALRRSFFVGLFRGIRVVWPVLSALVGLIVTLGAVVAVVERWPVRDGIYFAFVSGLTIGYGDLAPTTLLSRTLAIVIGLCGLLVTALLAAVTVKALPATDGER